MGTDAKSRSFLILRLALRMTARNERFFAWARHLSWTAERATSGFGRPARRTARLLAAPALALALLNASCRTGAPPVTGKPGPAAYLTGVERAASAPGASAELLARAGVATWLVTGNAKQANHWLELAFVKEPRQPLAELGETFLAQETLDDAGRARAALDLLARSPASLEAEIAAARLPDLLHLSPALDRQVEAALAGLDSASLGLTGTAAVRAREALLAIRVGRNDDTAAARTRSALGMPSTWTVVGPLSAFHLRDASAPSPFDDPKAPLAASYPSPIGPVQPRVMPTPSGNLDLTNEPWRGDGFEALSDVTVPVSGVFLVSLSGAQQARLYLDGALVVERSAWPRRPPRRSWGAVQLPKGVHRLRVRFFRVEGSSVAVELARADGAPARLAFQAPTVGEPSPAATAQAAALPESASGRARALVRRDPRDPVARWLAVLALEPDDGEAARSAMPKLVETAGDSAAVRSLDLELTESDPDLPEGHKLAVVAQDLDAILKRQPDWAQAQLLKFTREREDKRFDDASLRLSVLAKLLGDKSPRLAMLKALLASARGDRASARKFSDLALLLDPGRCSALELRSSLARSGDEVKIADALTPQLAGCPAGEAVEADFYRQRGRFSKAEALLRLLVARDPMSVGLRERLADLRLARGDPKGAAAALAPLLSYWPRRTDALLKDAEIWDLSGRAARAEKLREQAYAIDGSDVQLAQQIAIAHHTALLPWAARDGQQVIAAYLKSGFHADAPAVKVLDLDAMELSKNGSRVERTHSIVQVLDKRGIERYGEVDLPPNAVPLVVRTIKQDGRILDAQAISEKKSISLPDLEPGDFAEYEFVTADGPRSPAVPGWQGGQFFFEEAGTPFYESTYLVRVPKSAGMSVDSQRIADVSPPKGDGDWLTFSYTRHEKTPFLPEPVSVSEGEVLPWVEVGSGAGVRAEFLELADFLPLRARVTGEIEALVRGTKALPPLARVKAIVERVRDEVHGDSSSDDFSRTATEVLADGRGNRLLLLQAALTAAGIPARLVAARPYSANPYHFRFPRLGVYSDMLLRIDPPGSAPAWMDFELRQAPFDRIPAALSGCDAYLLPNPGGKIEHLELPTVDPSLDRTDASLEAKLLPDGTLEGVLTQTAYGFDAAAVRHQLANASFADVKKMQERVLGTLFRGVVLEKLAIDDSGDPAQPLVARSTIRVPHFALQPDGTVALPSSFGPEQLGPRFLALAERKTPLLVSSTDVVNERARIALPAGAVATVLQPVALKGPFGSYDAAWKKQGAALVLDESMRILRGRISPAKYPGFEAFASGVDAAQAREIPVVLAK